MREHGAGQGALFRGELAGFVAHISWRPGQGWHVSARSWDVGQEPSESGVDFYEHLTLDEALDVLSAEVATRCEWLRP